MSNNNTFTIGIAGDSGSGKTMLVSTIEKALGRDRIALLDGDGDHKWERGDKHWLQYTHLNPHANNLSKQAEDLKKLKKGESILRSEYDHETGKFTEPKKVLPKPYVILCGLHSLYLPETRSNLDLMIYMDIDESLRRSWKIQRDVKERGHSEEKVLEDMKKRLPDAGKYVYPQREYADISIRYFCEPEDKTHDNLYFQVASYVKFDVYKVQKCLASYNAEIDYYRDEYYGRNIIAVYGPRMESRCISLGEIIKSIGIDNIQYRDVDIDLFHGIMLLFILATMSTLIGKNDDR